MNSKNRPTHRPTVRQVMIKLLKDKDKERILTRDQNRDSVPQAGSRCRRGAPSLLAALARHLVSWTWRWRGWETLAAWLSSWETASLDAELRGVGAPWPRLHPPTVELPLSWTWGVWEGGSRLQLQYHWPSLTVWRVHRFPWINVPALEHFIQTSDVGYLCSFCQLCLFGGE